MERLFDLDWQLLADSFLSIIAVFFLFLALSYLLFNPARKMLQSRRDKIRGELEKKKKSMEDADSLRAEYEEKLKNIDREAQEILSSARKKALANEKQILSQAKEEAARILERAHMEAELEKQKMADNMKREMISIASLMAGRVVSATVDTALQNRLIEETLQEIGESTWQS